MSAPRPRDLAINEVLNAAANAFVRAAETSFGPDPFLPAEILTHLQETAETGRKALRLYADELLPLPREQRGDRVFSLKVGKNDEGKTAPYVLETNPKRPCAQSALAAFVMHRRQDPAKIKRDAPNVLAKELLIKTAADFSPRALGGNKSWPFKGASNPAMTRSLVVLNVLDPLNAQNKIDFSPRSRDVLLARVHHAAQTARLREHKRRAPARNANASAHAKLKDAALRAPFAQHPFWVAMNDLLESIDLPTETFLAIFPERVAAMNAAAPLGADLFFFPKETQS